jgi:hypothetical protein
VARRAETLFRLDRITLVSKVAIAAELRLETWIVHARRVRKIAVVPPQERWIVEAIAAVATVAVLPLAAWIEEAEVGAPREVAVTASATAVFLPVDLGATARSAGEAAAAAVPPVPAVRVVPPALAVVVAGGVVVVEEAAAAVGAGNNSVSEKNL